MDTIKIIYVTLKFIYMYLVTQRVHVNDHHWCDQLAT